jgi:hypothetical protein
VKLYLVTCRGMHTSAVSSVAHGIAYVVAPDPTTAYEMLRSYLEEEELGFEWERELDRIELLAEASEFPACRHRLLGVKP